jgi:hypothetical protein
MLSDATGQDHAAAGVVLDYLTGSQALLIAGLLSRTLPSGSRIPRHLAILLALRSPISPSSGCKVPERRAIAVPRWISDIVGAADLVLAMVLGSVLLLGRRSGETRVLSTRRQRPTWGGRDDGKLPGRASAGNRFQPGEIRQFAYSLVDFGGFGGECPS